MWIESVFLGLAAIVTSSEVDCKVNWSPGSLVTEPHEVVLLNPGGAATHYPKLWVRVDFLENSVATCYHQNEYRKPEPTAAANCTVDPDEKWAVWDLSNKEMLILQGPSAEGKMKVGRRKRGGRCWAGKAPGDQNKACKGAKADCESDVSWIPDFAKADGDGTIKSQALLAPETLPFVGAVVTGLAGELSASGDSSTWGNAWSWEWNYPHCAGRVPQYQQKFTLQGAIGQVKSDAAFIYLIDLDTSEETEIAIVDTTTKNNPAKLEVWNLPDKNSPALIQRGNRCFIAHFAHYYALVDDDMPLCRRVPYFEIAPAAKCDDSLGAGDPFCPPVIFGKP